MATAEEVEGRRKRTKRLRSRKRRGEKRMGLRGAGQFVKRGRGRRWSAVEGGEGKRREKPRGEVARREIDPARKGRARLGGSG